MILIPENLLVLDVETSGLDPRDHGILEIGAVKLATGEEFSREVRLADDKLYQTGVYTVNGYTEEAARHPERMSLEAGLSDLVLWLGRPRIGKRWLMAGSNPEFDKGFLKATMYGDVFAATFAHTTVALQGAAVAYFVATGQPLPMSLSADGIYKALGLPTEPNPHKALQGCRYEAHAFHVIFNRLQLRTTALQSYQNGTREVLGKEGA